MANWPSWLQLEIKNATSADRQTAAKFAMSLVDYATGTARIARQNPNDAGAQAAAKKYLSYATPDGNLEHPTVFANQPDNPFWTSTPERKADHDLFVKRPQSITVTTTTDLNPLHAATRAVNAVEKIPVIGDAVKITGDIYGAPFRAATAIASGERLDHVAIGVLKDQIKTIKDEAPYAQMVVSLVPGVGTGVSAAIGAGTALVEGQSITDSLKAGIRGALPGGPLAQAAFDTAVKVASGENVAQAALESSRGLLPPGPAQAAFDVGVAVATGQKLQNALAKGLTDIAPGQLQSVLSAGEHAVATTPGLADALKSVASSAGQQGFNLAAGLLSHSGINETSLTAVRGKLTPEVQQGFDAALKSQIPHTAWLANVVNPPKTASIKMSAPPSKPAAPKTAPIKISAPPPKTINPIVPAGAYAPYPKLGVSGPVDADAVWGPVITDMDGGMQWAGLSAVHGSKGRPRAVQGPDGIDYLFEINNGALTARRRVA